MGIQINIDKRHLVIVLFAVLLVVGVVYVVAQASPNPGHPLVEVENAQARVTGTCPGQVIVGVNPDGTVNCEADNVGSGLTNCVRREVFSNAWDNGDETVTSIATCNAGEVRSGGGGRCANGANFGGPGGTSGVGTYPSPSSNLQWITICHSSVSVGHAYSYAVCCS